jgi:hypothetical protein
MARLRYDAADAYGRVKEGTLLIVLATWTRSARFNVSLKNTRVLPGVFPARSRSFGASLLGANFRIGRFRSRLFLRRRQQRRFCHHELT